MKFKAHLCESCGQTKDYALPLSRGLAMATIAIHNAISRLGRNCVHVGKEMVADPKTFGGYKEMIVAGFMTFRMEGNLSFLHRHGIVAAGPESGEWILTKKGGAFLRGEPVPRVAIVSKVTGHQEGYWNEAGTTTIQELLKTDSPWWNVPISEAEESNLPLFVV